MKEFFDIMLKGIQVIYMSCSSVASFVLAYLLFKKFINATGFAALFLAISIIACICIGFVYIFLLGILVQTEEKGK